MHVVTSDSLRIVRSLRVCLHFFFSNFARASDIHRCVYVPLQLEIRVLVSNLFLRHGK